MAPGVDPFYHPASEDELVSLVKMAKTKGCQLRVRGSAHSVSHAIYADPVGELRNVVSWQTPPSGHNIEVMLDRYCGWRVKDEARKLVEADAGIHLGDDPSDPTGTATLKSSLLWQLWDKKRWTLSDVGGITHQTVSGFTAMGSSGGSLRYSVYDNLWGFRVIDATGTAHEFSRDDDDPERFYAMAPNMGLLGVVSTIVFQCEDAFNITGQEAITTVEHCAIDLFGPGTPDRPSLEAFFRDVDYARIEWWPQRGADRVLVWQAQRIEPQPGFLPTRYQEFGSNPAMEEVPISLLLTVLGNLDHLSDARAQIKACLGRVVSLRELMRKLKKLGKGGELLAKFLSCCAEGAVDAAIDLLALGHDLIEPEVPRIFSTLIPMFVRLDSDKPGTEKGEPQAFRDYSWQGLPMDNAVDDVLLPTGFTEIWVPLVRTREVMQLLCCYFNEPKDDHASYARTGLYAWELYTAKPTRMWMSPSYTTGDDEWKDGGFRIDPYWFEGNPGDPAKCFYPQHWELLRKNNIPFRLHWGKYQPDCSPEAPEWVEFFQAQYPRWGDFLRLRAERDPANTFLTSYWRDRFGLWQEQLAGG
jgi:hypothetical protein